MMLIIFETGAVGIDLAWSEILKKMQKTIIFYKILKPQIVECRDGSVNCSKF